MLGVRAELLSCTVGGTGREKWEGAGCGWRDEQDQVLKGLGHHAKGPWLSSEGSRDCVKRVTLTAGWRTYWESGWVVVKSRETVWGHQGSLAAVTSVWKQTEPVGMESLRTIKIQRNERVRRGIKSDYWVLVWMAVGQGGCSRPWGGRTGRLQRLKKGIGSRAQRQLTKGEQRGRRKTATVCPRSQSKVKVKVLGQTPRISSQQSPEYLNPGLDI